MGSRGVRNKAQVQAIWACLAPPSLWVSLRARSDPSLSLLPHEPPPLPELPLGHGALPGLPLPVNRPECPFPEAGLRLAWLTCQAKPRGWPPWPVAVAGVDSGLEGEAVGRAASNPAGHQPHSTQLPDPFAPPGLDSFPGVHVNTSLSTKVRVFWRVGPCPACSLSSRLGL